MSLMEVEARRLPAAPLPPPAPATDATGLPHEQEVGELAASVGVPYGASRRSGAAAPGTGMAGTTGGAGAAPAQASSPGGSLATAMQMAPEQRRDAHTRIADRMAQDMDPATRKQLADDRNLLEFAAANTTGGAASLDQAPPAPPTDLIELPGMGRPSIQVSADPVFLRHWVERTYREQGLAGVRHLPWTIAAYAGDFHTSPARREFARHQVIPALHHQIEMFRTELETFERQFGDAATRLVSDTLDQSERVARAEMAHYGIELDTKKTTFSGPDDLPHRGTQTVTTTSARGADNPAARDMAKTASELAANQREIDRMHARAKELRDVQLYRERGAPGAGAGAGAEPPPSVDPKVLASAPDAAHLPMLLAALDRHIAAANHAHEARIGEATTAYPLLASYKHSDGDRVHVDADALDRLKGSGRAQAIYDRVAPVLNNIAMTRAALGGRLNVWQEPRVVQLTMAQLLVAPGSLRGAMVEHKVATETAGSWTDWAMMALSFGLAILTAIPTGGSSLAAAVVVSATVGGAVADVYLIVDHLRTYQLDAAKAGTDLDAQARAISAEQPSLFWLALDLLATGVGLSAAAKTFAKVAKDLAKAERAAASGARLTAEETDAAIANVHRLAREGQMSADAAERAAGKLRLAEDVKASGTASHTADAAHEGEHKAGHAGQADRRSSARHDTRARVGPESLIQLEQRLGVPIVIDDTLANGAELHYALKRGRLGVGTDIDLTEMRVGRAATIEDILAHRTTIERVTRYNGALGKLRNLWDRLVVKSEAVNRFRRGTRAWESFEELQKLDELINLRRAGWNPRVLDRQILDEEIDFLERYRAYHEGVLARAEETGATRGAGHIDKPDDIGASFDDLSHRGAPGDLPDEASLRGESGRLGDSGPEVDAVTSRSRTASGVVEHEGQVTTNQHHVFPKERAYEKWFKDRGFDVDEWCIDLLVVEHQAQHGGGNWRLARRVALTQPGTEWNAAMMRRLLRREALKRTTEGSQAMLTPGEILEVGRELMQERGVGSLPFRRYAR